MACTLVTCYYPLPSKNTESVYMAWAKTYMTLEAPIVLFTPPDYVDRFRAMRSSRPIYIVGKPFTELEMWARHADVWKHQHGMDREKHHHSPELYALWAQKSSFVQEAFCLNPFHTDYFFWCDIGAFRGPTIPEIIRTSFPSTQHLPSDRILLCSVNPLQSSEHIVRSDGIPGDFVLVDRIVGGLWGGSGTGCYRWHLAYCAMLKRYFLAGRFAGKDQSVMLSAYIDDPSVAHIACPSDDIKTTDTIVITDTLPYNVIADRFYINPWFYLQCLASDMEMPFALDTSYTL